MNFNKVSPETIRIIQVLTFFSGMILKEKWKNKKTNITERKYQIAFEKGRGKKEKGKAKKEKKGIYFNT